MKLSKKCNAYGGQLAGQFVYCTRPRDHVGQHGAAPNGELVTWSCAVGGVACAACAATSLGPHTDHTPWWRRALRWMVRA